MGTVGKNSIFAKAIEQLIEDEDKLSVQILEALTNSYFSKGQKGIDELFIDIRQKYQIVGDENEDK